MNDEHDFPLIETDDLSPLVDTEDLPPPTKWQELMQERLETDLLSGVAWLPDTAEPQRVYWRGRRQKVYQLVAWGLLGELPTKRSVVRHLCNNRLCIHPEHLKVGTQAQNLRDQRLNRIKDWPLQ